jgi:hypothetical protein
MKAQASFILILGLLFIIVIVIYYASYGFSPPPDQGGEKLLVEQMIDGIITSGSETILKAMEMQGGYLVPPEESVSFAYVGVPYWQICQNDISPTYEEIEERIETGISYFVNENIQDIRDFFGKNLSISNVSRADVNIVGNKMDVSVYMTTRFEGQVIKQPYRVSIPTNIKQLLDFANDTITEINKDPSQGGRFFETFTITSLYNSRYLPTFGLMTECGESLFLSSSEISNHLKMLAVHTMTHTRWWEESNIEYYYGINQVNGKQYQNLKPRLLFPDGFDVNSQSSISLKNDQWFAKYPIPIRICMSVYNIKYDLSYPIVINLNDSETGYDFNFAVYVNVDEMRAGDCENVSDIDLEDKCEDTECNASIRVKDCSGNPISGAKAYFSGCMIGESDSSGLIQDKIPCGSGELFITHSKDYDYISKTESSGNLNGVDYSLCKINELTVQINERSIIGSSGLDTCHPCTEPTDCVGIVDRKTCELSPPGNCAFIIFKSLESGQEYMLVNNDLNLPDECSDQEYFTSHPDICLKCSSMEIQGFYLPTGNYELTASLFNPISNKNMGYLKSNMNILETSTQVTINVPNFGIPSDNSYESQNSCGISALRSCGKDPLVVT